MWLVTLLSMLVCVFQSLLQRVSLFLQSPLHPLNPVVRLTFIQQGLKLLTHDVHNTGAGQASVCVKPLSSERKCSGSFCLWQRSSAIVRVRAPVHTAARYSRPGPYLDISVEHVTQISPCGWWGRSSTYSVFTHVYVSRPTYKLAQESSRS